MRPTAVLTQTEGALFLQLFGDGPARCLDLPNVAVGLAENDLLRTDALAQLRSRLAL